MISFGLVDSSCAPKKLDGRGTLSPLLIPLLLLLEIVDVVLPRHLAFVV